MKAACNERVQACVWQSYQKAAGNWLSFFMYVETLYSGFQEFFSHIYKIVEKSSKCVEHKTLTRLHGCRKHLQYKYIEIKQNKNCLKLRFCSKYALTPIFLHTFRLFFFIILQDSMSTKAASYAISKTIYHIKNF